MLSINDIPSERKCRRILHKIVFGSEKECPHGSHELTERRGYCWCGHCRNKVRVKAFTWLSHSKLSHRQIFVLLLCWQNKIAPGSIVSLIGISYPTVQRWYVRFRKYLPEESIKLSGRIEIDESYFGKRKFGHQTIVLGARDHTGKTVYQPVEDRDSLTLMPFVLKHIAQASLVCSDAHGGYFDLEYYGYGHQICNHAKGDFGSTAKIENRWSTAKRHIKSMYCRFIYHYLPGLLKEWQARYNHPELFTNPTNYLQVCLVPSSLT